MENPQFYPEIKSKSTGGAISGGSESSGSDDFEERQAEFVGYPKSGKFGEKKRRKPQNIEEYYTYLKNRTESGIHSDNIKAQNTFNGMCCSFF